MLVQNPYNFKLWKCNNFIVDASSIFGKLKAMQWLILLTRYDSDFWLKGNRNIFIFFSAILVTNLVDATQDVVLYGTLLHTS